MRKQLSDKVSIVTRTTESLKSQSAWAIWRKRDVEKLQADLGEWVTHFHLALMSIQAAEGFPGISETRTGTALGRILNLFQTEEFQDAGALDKVGLPWPRDNIEIMEENGSFALAQLQGAIQIIVEFIPYDLNLQPSEIEGTAKQLENTARFLCQADPQQTRILRCIGYFHDADMFRFGMVLEMPKGYCLHRKNGVPVPTTLHDIWDNRPPTHSLDQRVRLARDISTAILYVHAVGWVHKAVSPQKILLFDEMSISDETKAQLGYLPQAFLLGLCSARNDRAVSDLQGDVDWKKPIYCHPERQHRIDNARFRMSFDIYSIGVIMLELALWGLPHFRRFVDMPEVFAGTGNISRKDSLMELVNGSTERNRQLGRGIHCELGRKYREIVLYCLQRGPLDGDGNIEFVQHVWSQLNELARAL